MDYVVVFIIGVFVGEVIMHLIIDKAIKDANKE